MKAIPAKIHSPYVAFLKEHKIIANEISFYLKWLKYYLDFCQKYSHRTADTNSLSHFIKKLKQKNQSEKQIEQAKNAVSLFYKLIKSYTSKRYTSTRINSSVIPKNKVSAQEFNYNATQSTVLDKNQSWKNEFDQLINEIKIRQYARKTLRAYRTWARSFQAYLKSKSPQRLNSNDAKKFITYLAVERKVSASTQNQAFNALLFFYRHVLKKEFGDFKDIPRAKKTKYAPSILSRKEIDKIINNLQYPYTLVVKLLYGCGLRLTEGLNLRVRDFDFEEGIITVYGKGRKFRKINYKNSVPIS